MRVHFKSGEVFSARGESARIHATRSKSASCDDASTSAMLSSAMHSKETSKPQGKVTPMMEYAGVIRQEGRNRTLIVDFRRAKTLLLSISTLWIFSTLWNDVYKRQQRVMNPMRNLQFYDDASVTHQHKRANAKENNNNVGIACTTRSSKNLIPWLNYHRSIGVSHFFITLDAEEVPMDVERVYQQMRDVTVYTSARTNSWRSESKILGLERMQRHVHDPICGVDRVFVQQALNVEYVIHEILEGNVDANHIDWIVHIDSDELIYPAGAENNFNVRNLLAEIPDTVGRVVFPNYEAVPEKLVNSDPFVDVTLFRRSHKHVDSGIYTKYKDASKGDNPRYFLGYSNGKSAARIYDDLRPVGVHNFEHVRSKNLKEIVLNESAILHYGFTDFSHVVGRFSQCDCPREFTHKCKRLPFDMEFAHKYDELYLTSREDGELQKWYETRVVGESAYVVKFLKLGILTRIHLPSILIQHQRRNTIYYVSA